MTVDHTAAVVAVTDLLAALGVAHDHPHTAETPERVARAWAETLSGYDDDAAVHLARQFPAPASPGPVIVSGIRVSSTCAHHLLPIEGVATVAYEPWSHTTIVGLSKLARVVEVYARRLQVQEQIGSDVVDALTRELAPFGSCCVITAAHGCMTHRGVAQHATRTTTVTWAGEWPHRCPVDVMAEHRAALAPR